MYRKGLQLKIQLTLIPGKKTNIRTNANSLDEIFRQIILYSLGQPAIKNDRIYTYADYCSWPDDERWELIDGVAYNMSPRARRLRRLKFSPPPPKKKTRR